MIVPEWQRQHLEDGQKKIDMTYQEWVDEVVNRRNVSDYFHGAVGDLVGQHFRIGG